MIYIDEESSELIQNYKAYTMRGSNMSPAVNEGDFLVVDIDQKFIISGDIYPNYLKMQISELSTKVQASPDPQDTKMGHPSSHLC